MQNITLQYVNSRIEFIITELFDVQKKVAEEIEQKEICAQLLRADFLKRLSEKNNNQLQNAHIEGENDMPKLKYGEGTICLRQRTNKDGTVRRCWQGRIFKDGKQTHVYAKTQAECLAKMKKLRTELNAERKATKTKSSNTIDRRYLTFGKWLDQWLVDFKEKKLRKGYYAELCGKVEKIKSALGDLKLDTIKAIDLQHYLNSLPSQNNTVKIYDILNGSLQKAEDFEIIKRNPCKVIERPTYAGEKRRAFELDEQCSVLDALTERYKSVFFFLCCTGLRIGEFLALTPQNIDFERGCINVRESQSARTKEIDKTKTTAGERKVYFAKELFERFDVQTLGTYSYNAIKKAFLNVYAKLGIEGISATHSCRHTYASLLYAVHVPDKVIQKQCGHADVQTTLETYTDILLKGDSPIYKYILQLKKVLSEHFQLW